MRSNAPGWPLTESKKSACRAASCGRHSAAAAASAGEAVKALVAQRLRCSLGVGDERARVGSCGSASDARARDAAVRGDPAPPSRRTIRAMTYAGAASRRAPDERADRDVRFLRVVLARVEAGARASGAGCRRRSDGQRAIGARCGPRCGGRRRRAVATWATGAPAACSVVAQANAVVDRDVPATIGVFRTVIRSCSGSMQPGICRLHRSRRFYTLTTPVLDLHQLAIGVRRHQDRGHFAIAASSRKLQRRSAAAIRRGSRWLRASTSASSVAVWRAPPSPRTIDSINAVQPRLLT